MREAVQIKRTYEEMSSFFAVPTDAMPILSRMLKPRELLLFMCYAGVPDGYRLTEKEIFERTGIARNHVASVRKSLAAKGFICYDKDGSAIHVQPWSVIRQVAGAVTVTAEDVNGEPVKDHPAAGGKFLVPNWWPYNIYTSVRSSDEVDLDFGYRGDHSSDGSDHSKNKNDELDRRTMRELMQEDALKQLSRRGEPQPVDESCYEEGIQRIKRITVGQYKEFFQPLPF